ncbi:MAG: adenylosuccinate lyase [Candidatus Syntropharchaeia archaeon]
MPIHPIEYRYGTPEMKSIWTEEEKLKKLLEVEAALARSEADVGIVPEEAAEVISKRTEDVNLERVKEIEREIGHDIMAVVIALSEKCGEYGGWVHLGATSNDISDTALALHLRDATSIIEKRLGKLMEVLIDLSEKHKKTVCVGRTHGQIAIPTTYGMRFALWACEIERHMKRLEEVKSRILVGKMSGAVGTGAAFGEKGIEIEKKCMEYLGLKRAEITNQIVQRDRHAEFLFLLANIATTLDKICTEIRTLSRTEIRELEERFGERQVGSSTMPHKRNPVRSEQVCGLARIIRSLVGAGLLNNTLWDERDLTNSSPERILFPEACILTDYIIKSTTSILSEMVFHPENIRKNLELTKGLNMSEAVMIRLSKDFGRQKAHEIVRKCAMKAYGENRHLKEVLLEDEEVSKILSREELEKIMDPENYIGTAIERVESVIKRLSQQK